jgi:hypothetical protein
MTHNKCKNNLVLLQKRWTEKCTSYIIVGSFNGGEAHIECRSWAFKAQENPINSAAYKSFAQPQSGRQTGKAKGHEAKMMQRSFLDCTFMQYGENRFSCLASQGSSSEKTTVYETRLITS